MGLDEAAAYVALVEFEMTGELPDEEAFDACVNARESLKGLIARYTRVIDECQNAEHLRRLPKLNCAQSREAPTDDATDWSGG